MDGKYKIKLIFEECVKEIEVIVSISDDSKVKKLEMKIEELNDLTIKSLFYLSNDRAYNYHFP